MEIDEQIEFNDWLPGKEFIKFVTLKNFGTDIIKFRYTYVF